MEKMNPQLVRELNEGVKSKRDIYYQEFENISPKIMIPQLTKEVESGNLVAAEKLQYAHNYYFGKNGISSVAISKAISKGEVKYLQKKKEKMIKTLNGIEKTLTDMTIRLIPLREEGIFSKKVKQPLYKIGMDIQETHGYLNKCLKDFPNKETLNYCIGLYYTFEDIIDQVEKISVSKEKGVNNPLFHNFLIPYEEADWLVENLSLVLDRTNFKRNAKQYFS